VRVPLDHAAMRAAAEALIGTHDFEAFRSAGCPAPHAIRTLYRLTIEAAERSELRLEVVGNAFCRNMVRIIAGTLVRVGEGRMPAGAVAEILRAKDRTLAGMTAPPEGLCLEEVIYDDRLPPRPHGQRPAEAESSPEEDEG
jgi:tRNA pseudouridine38-40 synthase